MKEINKNFDKSKEFKQNCQMCVVAFEAGLRGNKIKVKGNNFKNPIIKLLAKKPEIAYIDPITNKNPKTTILNFKNYENLLNYIRKNIKENQRYELQTKLNNNSEYGHILCLDVYNGKIRLADPQFGTQTKTEEDAIKYLKLIDYNEEIKILRVDNLKFTPGILDIIKE